MQHNDDLRILSENIRYLRKSQKLSQAEMAKRLHISVGYVRRLEHGELPPHLGIDFVRYVYMHFGVSPSKLFGSSLTAGRHDKVMGGTG